MAKSLKQQLQSPQIFTIETDKSDQMSPFAVPANKRTYISRSNPNAVQRPIPPPVVPVTGDFILTEDSFFMITEDNNNLILE